VCGYNCFKGHLPHSADQQGYADNLSADLLSVLTAAIPGVSVPHDASANKTETQTHRPTQQCFTHKYHRQAHNKHPNVILAGEK